MTNAILRGKPDAGNPHVRFDEGEVASAKPRRGSLLYNIPKTVAFALLAGLSSGLAARSARADEPMYLSFLESSCEQWVDTGYKHNANTRIVCEVNFASSGQTSSWNGVFGTNKGVAKSSMEFWGRYGGSNRPVYDVHNQTQGSENTFPYDEFVTLTCDKSTATWTGSKPGSLTVKPSGTIGSDQTLYIFALHRVGNPNDVDNPSRMKLRSFYIYEGETLLHAFRPYRNADGALGLIDLLDTTDKAFHPNLGTKPFTWSGIAYTVSDATLVVHEVTLSDADQANRSAIEKVGDGMMNVAAMTTPLLPLTVTGGTVSLQDGTAQTIAVNGTLTLKGGTRLAFDALADGGDTLSPTAVAFDASASADCPVAIDVNVIGQSELVGERTLISAGLQADDVAKFAVTANRPVVLEVRDGALILKPDVAGGPVFFSTLEATGEQWVDTGYNHNANTRIVCEVNFASSGHVQNWSAVFGTNKGVYNSSMEFWGLYSGTYQPVYDVNNQKYGAVNNFSYDEFITLTCDSSKATWTGSKAGSLTVSPSRTVGSDLSLYVFALNRGNMDNPSHYADNPSRMKLRSFDIYEGETLKHAFRPGRSETGAIGLVDTKDGSFHRNLGPTPFTWSGIAYKVSGETLVVQEGVLLETNMTGYAAVEKEYARGALDASAVTNYPALTLSAGVFSLQDGESREYTVTGALTLKGGARLALDLTTDGSDRFVAGSVVLDESVTVSSPVEVALNAVGLSELAANAKIPVFPGATFDTMDAMKFRVVGFPAQFAVEDGALYLVRKETGVVTWTGAAGDGKWSNARNWLGNEVPEPGATVRFDLAAGGETTFDIADGRNFKAIVFGESAGAFTIGGGETLGVTAAVTNLSTSAQTFAGVVNLGVVGQPVELVTTGNLAFTGSPVVLANEIVKGGAGPLTADDTFLWNAANVTVRDGAQLDVDISQGIAFDGTMMVDGTLENASAAGILSLDGTLAGNGRITGGNIRFGGTANRWAMAANDTGFTSKVDASGVTDPEFATALKLIEVTYTGDRTTSQTLVVCPQGALTPESVTAIALDVHDAEGNAVVNCGLVLENGNLVLHLNDTGVVRTAVWTRGAGTDALDTAANWLCSNDVGVVENGLPTYGTSVTIPDGATFSVPTGTVLNVRQLILPAYIGGDCDWRGLDVPIDGTLDLRGHKLYLSNLAGSGTVTDTSNTNGYQRLEFIDSDGSAYVNTGYKPRHDTRIVAHFYTCTRTGSWTALFGMMKDNKPNESVALRYFNAENSLNALFCNNDYASVKISNMADRDIQIELKYGLLTLNGTEYTIPSVNEPSDGDLMIFGLNQYASGKNRPDSCQACRLYSFKIYEGETLVHDFVPARRNSDGALGLLDVANGGADFKANAGSGKFRSGPVVVADEFVTTGELHLDVAEGQTETGGSLKIGGTVKLVKEGAGTYSPVLGNQNYLGGLSILEGTVHAGGYGTEVRLGAPGNAITVGEDGTLDMDGTREFHEYAFTLAGGEWVNTTPLAQNWNYSQATTVRVTEDSTIDFNSWAVLGYYSRPTSLDLGGHTLTMNTQGNCYLCRTTATRGTIAIHGPIEFGYGDFYGPETTLDMDGKLLLNGVNCHVGTYIARATTTEAQYNGDLFVYEKFTPLTDNFWGCVIKNGVTIDLSARTAAWNVKGNLVGTSGFTKTTVKFEDNATVYIDLGSRHLGRNEKIVEWNGTTKPTNLNTLKFELAPGSKRGGQLCVGEDGLYYRSGFVIYITQNEEFIRVPEEFFENKTVNDEPITTDELAQAYMDQTESNGLKAWQNYAMGIEGATAANRFDITYEKIDEETIRVKTPIAVFAPPADSGVVVTYTLRKSTDEAATWIDFATGLATPEYELSVSSLDEGNSLWKFKAVITATEG